jgi:hypothetical protein
MADDPTVPDDRRDGLFERLSPEGRELVPVTFRSLHTSATAEATFLRLVESRPYRAKGYACSPFRKPISKCFGAPDPGPIEEDDV